MQAPSNLNDQELLRAWAVEQAGGDVDRAKRIVDFVRPNLQEQLGAWAESRSRLGVAG